MKKELVFVSLFLFLILGVGAENVCTDSDGGDDYYNKGIVVESGIQNIDTCRIINSDTDYLDGDSCSGDNCYVLEHICLGDYDFQASIFRCTNGCQDGACIPEELPLDEIDNPEEDGTREPEEKQTVCENDMCYTLYESSGEPSNKIDILFIPIGYDTQQDFLNAVEKNIDKNSENRGLLYFEPFKSNKDIFNFYYISEEEIPFQEEYQNYLDQMCWKWGVSCDSNFIELLNNWVDLFENIDYYIVLHKDSEGMIAIPPGKKGITTTGEPNGMLNHELGHKFGFGEHYDTGGVSSLLINTFQDALDDFQHPLNEVVTFDLAYESSVGGLIPPNCDEVGCPRWCEDYIKEPILPNQEVKEDGSTCLDLDTQDECLSSTFCTWVGESLYDNGEPYFDSYCIPKQDDYQDEDIGINCVEGTGCYYGCNGDGGWRATADGGIMRYATNNEGYDPIEIKVIKDYVYKKYGIEMKNPSESINCDGGECGLNDKCVPIGYRSEGEYCNINDEFVSQLESDSQCENHFECESNFCLNDECVSGNLMQKILNWFKRIFGNQGNNGG